MSRKSTIEIVPTNPLINAIEEIKKNHAMETTIGTEEKTKIVDIITFCDGQKYLDLLNSENNLDLYLPQRIILKCFYMGTIGNEQLELSQKEWEWLYSKEVDEEIDGVIYNKNIKDVIQKMHKRIHDPDMPYFKELQLVLGRRGTKCHSSDSIIATTEGSVTFGELNDRLSCGEKIGICTYDQQTLKRSVTYDIKTEFNGVVDCFTIETKRGIKETASWNHPYLIWRDGWEKPQFQEISKLLPGDRIAVAECTELFGSNFSIGIKDAALLGHLQGDGGITNVVGYTTSCPIMLKDFTDLINNHFPDYVVKYKSKYDYVVVKKSGRFSQKGSQKNEIIEWLKIEGCWGKKAIEKSVPDSILRGTKMEVAAFLSRLFGCDGYANVEKKTYKNHGGIPKAHIGYCSSSQKFTYGVRQLLQKFGIHAVVNKEIAKCNGKCFDAWKLRIVRKNCLEIFEKEINIFSKEKKVREVVQMAKQRIYSNSEFEGLPRGIWSYIKRIMEDNNLFGSDIVGKHGTDHNDRLRTKYSPNRNKIFSYGKSINDKFLIDIGQSDVKWDKVKSVIPVGKKPTIAIEVKGTNIIGSDLVSHNTLISSVITAYEAYKLLVINDGDPHGYYKLPADDEIAIINVALSLDQAGRLFAQIQSRLRNSPFFKGRIAKETTSEIRLYTDKDLAKQKRGTTIKVNGSIVLLCGHSSPDSLQGYSTILLLFDEIAYYDETGKVTGSYFYNRLKPSLSKFFKYKAARIVQISSPKGKVGIFYDTWKRSKNDDSILCFQLPTWEVNPDVPYNESELIRDREANIDMFVTEYGAQWAEGGSYHRYFPEELIQRCLKMGLSPHGRPQPGFNYYIHVDPAKKGNNYAAVMIGKQRYTNQMGHKRVRCVLAGVWIWRPLPGIGVQFNQVDKDMIQICSVFHPIMVTYDDYHSMQSLQLLKSHGINCHELSYNRSVKAKIYQNLRDLMAYQPEPELWLYDNGGDSALLIAELYNLGVKQTQKGFTLVTDRHADVKTDDLCDALAGACASANEGIRMALPEPVVVRTGWI